MSAMSCLHCEKTFKTQNALEKHTRNHYFCKKCDISFKTIEEKEEHHNFNHSTQYANKEKKCDVCSSIFASEKQYSKHMKTVHNEKNDKFMCSECGKQLKTKTELTQHINSKCGTIKQYQCKVCKQQLMSAGSLHNHMLRHSGSRSFMCRFCAKLFLTAGQLKVHERIHTDEKVFRCEVCGKGFCHRQSLLTHTTLHTGIKPFLCENCGKSFSCVGNLLKHRVTRKDSCGSIPLTTHSVRNPTTKIKLKINTPGTARLRSIQEKKIKKLNNSLESTLLNEVDDINKTSNNYSENDSKNISLENVANCEETDSDKICVDKNEADISGENISDQGDAININSLEKTGEPEENIIDNSYSDDNCYNDQYSDEEIASYNDDELKESSETQSLDNCVSEIKIEKAKEINKTEVSLKKSKRRCEDTEELIQFIKSRSLDDVANAKCKYCGKIYKQLKCLYKHEKTHMDKMGAGATRYKCSCCRKVFETKDACKQHQLAEHASILTCQECDKVFANLDSLKNHQQIFHMGVPRKTYTYICQKCGQNFKQKMMLELHEKQNCDNGPFFTCSICQKDFSSSHTLKAHMRIHTSEKKLLCKFCGKRFHWKGQLKVHERSHTGEKPYTCLFCPKAFAHRDSLITHSTMHTGVKPHFCKGCGWRFSCIGNLMKHKITHANTCGAWYEKNDKNDH